MHKSRTALSHAPIGGVLARLAAGFGWGLPCLAVLLLGSTPAIAQQAVRPSTAGHVPELGAWLDEVQIAEPVTYRHLAVYPLLLEEPIELTGRWLSLDEAVSRGVLVVTEKGGGSVPVVMVENRSRREHVLIMSGEVISGGKQSRTVRQDAVLSPGQRIELAVLCVEAGRWEGSAQFSAGGALVPQSIQRELRRGADQARIWSEVERNNRALGAENATKALDQALRSDKVQGRLAEVRRAIVPGIPRGTMGFIFVSGRRALGAEMFGSEELARELFPKLLDAYAVDCVIIWPGPARRLAPKHDTAIQFFRQVCRAGSRRSSTPGSGAGMRTRGAGLLGDGVSLGRTLVHYGVQVEHRILPPPKPIPMPRQLESPQQMRDERSHRQAGHGEDGR